MYEVGVILVWFQNRRNARKKRKEELFTAKNIPAVEVPAYTPRQVAAQPAVAPVAVAAPKPVSPVAATPKPRPMPRYVDGMLAPRRQAAPHLQPAQPRSVAPRPRSIQVPTRSIDGFMPYRPHPTNAS